MRRVTPFILLLLVCPLPARAVTRDTPARALLMRADSPPELRARLGACADSAAAAGNRLLASEALAFAGTSFQREGDVDSAVAWHRRAVERYGSEEQVLALADQLLLRAAPGDAAEVLQRFDALATRSETAPGAPIVARRAWALFLQDMPDSAAALFEQARALVAAIGVELSPEATWRYRMARVAAARGQHRQAADLLLPVVVESRGTDEEAVRLLEASGQALGFVPRLQAEVIRRSSELDQADLTVAAGVGGRLLGIAASDGFPLGGLLVPAARRAGRLPARPPLPAIVLMPPGDPLESCDSLALALRRRGITSLMLHLRGHGPSVGPSCPIPDAWLDREVSLQARVALDVRDALRAVARATPVDTTACILVGAGVTAPIAVEAALLEPRVKALLLVDPAPALVERGLMRARLARLRLPVFYQIAPERTSSSYWIVDAFYQAGDAAASRIVETRAGGTGLAQFQNDPELARRFFNWLDALLRPPAAPRATPPTPRRRG